MCYDVPRLLVYQAIFCCGRNQKCPQSAVRQLPFVKGSLMIQPQRSKAQMYRVENTSKAHKIDPPIRKKSEKKHIGKKNKVFVKKNKKNYPKKACLMVEMFICLIIDHPHMIAMTFTMSPEFFSIWKPIKNWSITVNWNKYLFSNNMVYVQNANEQRVSFQRFVHWHYNHHILVSTAQATVKPRWRPVPWTKAVHVQALAPQKLPRAENGCFFLKSKKTEKMGDWICCMMLYVFFEL